jgi:hypothetical protein
MKNILRLTALASLLIVSVSMTVHASGAIEDRWFNGAENSGPADAVDGESDVRYHT